MPRQRGDEFGYAFLEESFGAESLRPECCRRTPPLEFFSWTWAQAQAVTVANEEVLISPDSSPTTTTNGQETEGDRNCQCKSEDVKSCQCVSRCLCSQTTICNLQADLCTSYGNGCSIVNRKDPLPDFSSTIVILERDCINESVASVMGSSNGRKNTGFNPN